MGQIKFVVSMVMIALFTFAIVGFAINFAVDNNSAVDISDDSSFTNLQTQTASDISEDFRDESNKSYQSILDNNVGEGSQTTAKGTQFSITLGNFLGVFYNILKIPYDKIFGGKDGGFGVFFTAFIVLIGFIAFLYVWKTWVGRNPD